MAGPTSSLRPNYGPAVPWNGRTEVFATVLAFAGDDDDRAVRVVHDLAADQPINSRAKPRRTRDPTTIRSAVRDASISSCTGNPEMARTVTEDGFGRTRAGSS